MSRLVLLVFAPGSLFSSHTCFVCSTACLSTAAAAATTTTAAACRSTAAAATAAAAVRYIIAVTTNLDREAGGNDTFLVFNTLATAVVVVAKLDFMYGVRIFGINEH